MARLRTVGAMDDLVWYVAYGSNMCPERLGCYLAGGRPVGASRTYLGARDPRPPRRSEPLWLRHVVVFAGVSRIWDGGGVAFLEPTPRSDAVSPAVGHLLGREQLADIVAQENGGESPGPELVELPGEGRLLRVAAGRYDSLLGLRPIDGHAAVSLTAASRPVANDPSPAYCAAMERGRAHWWPR